MLALVGLLQMTAMLLIMTITAKWHLQEIFEVCNNLHQNALHRIHSPPAYLLQQADLWTMHMSNARESEISHCMGWLKWELVASLDCSYHTLTIENVKHHLVHSAFDSVAGKGYIFSRCLSVAYGRIYLLHDFVELISFQHGLICCLRYRLQQWY